ncbi:hypothetical protein VC83_05784 [Pseudogymnoascus destructans]|uniref:Uncharacterized protein n=1 Tax=Pseudogymnoascus destructans TaxID=655981 RepID=A0A177A5R2_9PEZI|nr:uncharacterized protein VC83_05784 [Pseudogymnoascus destructans]OAF56970.1 hypothetical protein VC83_05784 [Pseudogymnoascus destructans]
MKALGTVCAAGGIPASAAEQTPEEPLIIKDDSDDESDDEAEAGVASSDVQPQLLASIEDHDASECGPLSWLIYAINFVDVCLPLRWNG